MDIIKKIADYLNTDEITALMYFQVVEQPYEKEILSQNFIDCESKLSFLKSNCLVVEWANARDNDKLIVSAVPPDYSLSALLIREAWSKSSDVFSLSDINILPELSELKSRYHLLLSILPVINKKYVEHAPYAGELIYRIKGTENISSSIAMHLANAEEIVEASISPPQLMGVIVWDAIRTRMDCGIRYVRVTEFEEITRHGWLTTVRETADGAETIYILQEGCLPEKYYIIDKKTVIFFEKSKKSGRFKKEIQIIKNEGVASRFLAEYSRVLSRCIEFRELISFLRVFRENKTEEWGKKYEASIVSWLKDILDNGVFYTKAKYSNEFILWATQKCCEDGTIRVLQDGAAIVNYTLSDILNGE